MRAATIGVLMTGMLLSGCHQSPVASGPRSQGRFAGIGVFDAGRLWAEMSGAATAKDTAEARIADDEHVIVVLDSHTGEVRQCGDHSGYCVAMNPWTGSQGKLPVKLARHASDFANDERVEITKTTPAK